MMFQLEFKIIGEYMKKLHIICVDLILVLCVLTIVLLNHEVSQLNQDMKNYVTSTSNHMDAIADKWTVYKIICNSPWGCVNDITYFNANTLNLKINALAQEIGYKYVEATDAIIDGHFEKKEK